MPAPDSWRLSYAGVDLPFGGLSDVATFGEAPEVGTPDAAVDDAAASRTDGVLFGVDFLGGRTITFGSLLMTAPTADELRSKVSAFATKWRADSVRSTPGALATLTVPRSDGDRVVFGRPRRLATKDEHLPEGLVEVVADFSTVGPDAYSAAVTTAEVTLVPALGGGLMAPLSAPLSTTKDSDRSTTITVASELPAWPVVTIYGPITNPTVKVLGAFSFSLLTTLAYDERVTIDTTPWARTVLSNLRGSLAGKLTRTSTRLRNAAVPAGGYDLSLSGLDATGTARAVVSWRARFPNP